MHANWLHYWHSKHLISDIIIDNIMRAKMAIIIYEMIKNASSDIFSNPISHLSVKSLIFISSMKPSFANWRLVLIRAHRALSAAESLQTNTKQIVINYRKIIQIFWYLCYAFFTFFHLIIHSFDLFRQALTNVVAIKLNYRLSYTFNTLIGKCISWEAESKSWI